MKYKNLKTKLLGIPALLILSLALTAVGLSAETKTTSGNYAPAYVAGDYQFAPFASPTMQSGSCVAACARWVSCLGKKAKMSPAQKRLGTAQCMRQCNRNKTKVLACYKKTKNSCGAYFNCMLKLAR